MVWYCFVVVRREDAVSSSVRPLCVELSPLNSVIEKKEVHLWTCASSSDSEDTTFHVGRTADMAFADGIAGMVCNWND